MARIEVWTRNVSGTNALAGNKIKILFLVIIVTLLSVSIAQAFNSMGKKDMEFKFENYKTKEEAKAALLKLHPIGSPVDNLIKTLENAGSKVRELQGKEIYPEWKTETFKTAISYDYFEKGFIIGGYQWGGTIFVNKDNAIEKLVVDRIYEGL